MRTKEEERAKIIEILDREGAWVHVAMNYIYEAKHLTPISVKWRRDGLPKRTSSVGRLIHDLSKAIGYEEMARNE